MTGIVYLIGAGPGDPGLVTARGIECLHKCDIVIYDHLVPMQLLSELPPDVELIDAGKESGTHTLKQEGINQLLVDYAREGKIVGRFKGGDPFIFGRGGEEAIFLKENGIPFEVIPGITAGVAAPAFAGIPITHRGIAAQTVFVTAHEANDKSQPQVDWKMLAGLRNTTIVGYMGIKTLPEATSGLIKGGMNPSTPAAVILRGATSLQKTTIGILADISQKARNQKITPPAVFVIGHVVNLSETVKWFESRPLLGKRIVVTRAADQAGDLIRRLNESGAYAIPFPTIKTVNAVDRKYLDLITSREYKYDWLIFTSENGVRYFFKALHDIGKDLRCFKNARIAAVGEGTSKALKNRFIIPDFIPERFLTRKLAEELIAEFGVEGRKILRVRGEPAPSAVEDLLAENGADVDTIITYRTIKGTPLPRVRQDLVDNGAGLITFTSSSTVRNFVEILGFDTAEKLAECSTVLSIGPMTSNTIRELKLPVHIEAEKHSMAGLIEEIFRWGKRNEKG